MKPSSDGLDIVTSEEGRVDGVWLDTGDESVAEWEISEESGEDRDSETDNKEDQSGMSV